MSLTLLGAGSSQDASLVAPAFSLAKLADGDNSGSNPTQVQAVWTNAAQGSPSQLPIVFTAPGFTSVNITDSTPAVISRNYASAGAVTITPTATPAAGPAVVLTPTSVDATIANAAPIIMSVTVAGDGVTMTFVFSAAVTGDESGFSGSLSDFVYVSGSGTSTLTFTSNSPYPYANQIQTVDYDAGTGNVVSVSSGLPMASFAGQAIVNHSVQQAYNSSGTFTFVVPATITSLHVECYGGGGAGGATNLVGGGGGGAGGQYATNPTYTVIPGNSYTVVVGALATSGNAGNDSSFATTGVVAKGGAAGLSEVGGGTGGIGSDTGGVGTTVFAGGSGGDGTLIAGNSGAGGGGAGDEGAGEDAVANTAGAGTPNNQNGSGANGRTTSGNGANGSINGGGGAGGYNSVGTTSRTGGNGARGFVVIS